MKLFVPTETREGERRVALVPDTVTKLSALGLDVTVQSGAGVESFATDEDYQEAGATVIAAGDVAEAFATSEVIASVRPLDPQVGATLADGAVALSFLQPKNDTEAIAAIASAGATALSFDLVPRISRAQSMDALTSQALVTGYRGAIVGAGLAAALLPAVHDSSRHDPARQGLVLGAGVAGLQAIATAKRLGAVVSAYDVRAACADEVKSMGATFIELDLEALEAGPAATPAR